MARTDAEIVGVEYVTNSNRIRLELDADDGRTVWTNLVRNPANPEPFKRNIRRIGIDPDDMPTDALDWIALELCGRPVSITTIGSAGRSSRL